MPFEEPGLLERLPDAVAYLFLAAASLATEELAPLIGGVAAEEGHLDFVSVVAAVTVGIWALSTGLFFIGRWRAAWVRLKLRGSPPVVRKVLRAMRYRPWRTVILTRFMWGARVALPLAIGAAHVPVRIFVIGTAIASVVWASVFAAVGWYFGEEAMTLLREIKRYERAVAFTLLALAVGFVWHWRRRRARLKAPPPPIDTAP